VETSLKDVDFKSIDFSDLKVQGINSTNLEFSKVYPTFIRTSDGYFKKVVNSTNWNETIKKLSKN
jgi:hypothetical protein